MNTEEWFEKQSKRVDKKFYQKGMPIYILHSRVLQSAYAIMRLIDDINIDELSLKLFMLVKDVNFSDFVHRYEYVLEMAKEKPDVFGEQLYEFYVKMASFIKKNNYYEQFFAFLSFFQTKTAKDMEERTNLIYRAYVSLLLEQLEFLRANKFDTDNLVVGLTTDGKVLEIRDIFPNSDYPAHIALHYAANNKEISKKEISQLYAQHGYKVTSSHDARYIQILSQLYTNAISFLTPYMNEFTLDILPQKGFNPVFSEYCDRIPRLIGNNDELKELLLHRRKTLSANGLKIHFENSSFLNDLLLKEVYYDGAVICLYRIDTQEGETSGYYNTKDKQFASVFMHTLDNFSLMTDFVEAVVLWSYAAYVCVDEAVLPTTQSFKSFLDDKNVDVTFTAIGGKLRVPTDTKHIRTIAGDERYETETKRINGYIRKLPDGQKASEKAKLLAQSLGYELEDNETYVQPFERASWIVKKSKEQKDDD